MLHTWQCIKNNTNFEVYSGEALYVKYKKFTEQKQIQEHLLLDGILKFTATSAHQHRKATVLNKREDSAYNNPILETPDCAFVCSVADGHLTLLALDFSDFCQVLKINNVLNLIDADLSSLLMCKFGSVGINVCK